MAHYSCRTVSLRERLRGPSGELPYSPRAKERRALAMCLLSVRRAEEPELRLARLFDVCRD